MSVWWRGVTTAARAGSRRAASAVSRARNASSACTLAARLSATGTPGSSGHGCPAQPATPRRRHADSDDGADSRRVPPKCTTSDRTSDGQIFCPRAPNSGMVSVVMTARRSAARIDPLKIVFALGYVHAGAGEPVPGDHVPAVPQATCTALRSGRRRDAAPVREVVPGVELQADHRLPHRRLRPDAHAADRAARPRGARLPADAAGRRRTVGRSSG